MATNNHIFLIKTSLISLFIYISTCQYSKSLTRLAHYDEMHNVIGGNSAVNKTYFQYEDLIKNLNKLVGGREHRIISISLMDLFWPMQTKQRYIQQNFYNLYPGRPNQAVVNRQVSFYHHFSVCGSWINPAYLPSFVIKKFAKFYKYIFCDNLQEIFEVINKEFSYHVYSNIYVHSYDGLDKVSYVLGAYKLKYRNQSLSDVMKQIIEFHKKNGKDTLDNTYYHGLQWYCLQLKRTQKQCLVGLSGNNVDQLEQS